jgi:hypothetical protein
MSRAVIFTGPMVETVLGSLFSFESSNASLHMKDNFQQNILCLVPLKANITHA